MIWVLAVVVVGMIAVLAELLLSYQKRAHNLRLKQEPLRRSIREHAQAMQVAVSGIQESADGQIDELGTDLVTLAHRSEELRAELSRLEREVFGEGYDPNAPRDDKQDELIEEDDPKAGRVDEHDDPEEMLLEAREFHRQEVDGHRLSLQRDVDVVRRTMALLETKLRRGANAAQKKKG